MSTERRSTITDGISDCLDKLARNDLNCVITIDGDRAMETAGRVDRALGSGAGGPRAEPLLGCPIVVKDNIDTADLRTTLGSGVFAGRTPATDATVVARLRQAGAIIVAKANMTELACGTIGFNEHFGDVHNPHDSLRYSGGSSSGSAAAVGAGLVALAIGSDTSGSIRHPAAVCGVVGLKPTFGRVPTTGVSVCSDDLDHVGPIAADVATATAALAAMQDPGWDDPRTTSNKNAARVRRVGVLSGEFLDGCDADVVSAFDDVQAVLADLGLAVGDVDLGIDLAEADAFSNVLSADLLELYGEAVEADGEHAGAELLRWFAAWRQVESADHEAARSHQRHVRRLVQRVMADWDVLLCPTTRVGAGLLADAADEPRERRIGNCSLWAMTGQPSLTVPFGTSATGMPLGLLVNGRHGEDGLVLGFGAEVERAVRDRDGS